MSDQGFSAPAAAYDRHVGRYSGELGEALCDLAALAEGQRVLDVGCGPGALTERVAARVGVAGVAAVDPSEVFLDACRARVPGVDARLAAAEELPFPDGAFDVALSQLVVNFMREPARGLAEMRRVTRSGGVVASAVWDYAEGMQLLRSFWDAAVALDPEGAAPLDEGRAMRVAHPAALERLWHEAGLDDVMTGHAVVGAEYRDFDDLWAPFAAGVGPAGAYAKGLDDDRRAALRDAYAERLGRPDAPFRLTAKAWTVMGRVR